MKNNNALSFPQLTELLQKSLSESQSEWLLDAIKKIHSEPEPQETQLLLSAMTKRQLTSEVLHGTRWTIDEAARVRLLQTYIDTLDNKDNRYDAIWQAYRVGDENEKMAYIKGLYLLDSGDELLDMALHNGRTNNVLLFSALAQHNIYPAKYYDDNAFEQLVLKTLFLGLSIDLIDNLQHRLHPGLSGKCMDLVRERLAADREPPFSIWLAIDIRHLDDEGQALFLKFLSDPAKEHRYYSLLALKQLDLLNQHQAQLKRQQEVETEPSIRQLLANTTD